MAELKWIETARKLIGLKEDPRKGYTIKTIPEMWDFVNTKIGQTQRLKEKAWDIDDTAWCGLFVAYVLAQHDDLVKHIPVSYPVARSWANAGTKLKKPAYGSIAVFSRGNGMGHVGFVVGEDKVGNLMILGGNQSDSVSITPISKSRLLCCVWCGTQALPSETRYKLNEISHSLKVSTNEA